MTVSFSCASNKVIPIPGEETAILNNVYVEYYNIGDTYYRLEDFNKAITYYDKAMKNRKLYWPAYYKLAKCYTLISDWNKALPMYEKILKRDPDNSTIKASLAYLYVMQGDVKNAQKLYKELLDIEPENQNYIENYIAILIPDEDNYKLNKETVETLLNKLKENFPDNKNLEKFNSTIERYIPEEQPSDEQVSDENSEEITDKIETK